MIVFIGTCSSARRVFSPMTDATIGCVVRSSGSCWARRPWWPRTVQLRTDSPLCVGKHLQDELMSYLGAVLGIPECMADLSVLSPLIQGGDPTEEELQKAEDTDFCPCILNMDDETQEVTSCPHSLHLYHHRNALLIPIRSIVPRLTNTRHNSLRFS